MQECINAKPPVRATVITDASFRGGYGGWAGWLRIDGHPLPIKESGQLRSCENSTVAEVMAAANGVWLAAYYGATHILLQSDCMAVIHLTQRLTKSERLLGIWRELMDRPHMVGVHVTGRHVKGHGQIKDARTWVNDWCDKNARRHMEKGYHGTSRR